MGGVPILEQVISILRDFRKSRGNEFQLIALGVFGSVARGEATDDSDVNIVFSTARPIPGIAARIQQELEHRLERRVGILWLHRDLKPQVRARVVRGARFV